MALEWNNFWARKEVELGGGAAATIVLYVQVLLHIENFIFFVHFITALIVAVVFANIEQQTCIYRRNVKHKTFH